MKENHCQHNETFDIYTTNNETCILIYDGRLHVNFYRR